MTIATVEMPTDELEQLQADLASARAEVKRLRGGAPAYAPEVEKLRQERDHYAEQNGLLRDAANKLHRAEAENERLNRAITALVGERDAARAEVQEQGNELAEVRANRDQIAESLDALWDTLGIRTAADGNATDAVRKLRQQIADLEAALIEAHKGLRVSNAEHLHQRISAAALVIGRFRDWRYCPMCREISEPSGARHACGRMVPVDVIIARRPNTTEEQP